MVFDLENILPIIFRGEIGKTRWQTGDQLGLQHVVLLKIQSITNEMKKQLKKCLFLKR